MPYGIIDELEEFLFSLTVGIKPKEKSLTSRLQEETVAQVLKTYQPFYCNSISRQLSNVVRRNA